MLNRHVLMASVCVVGLSLVGSQLSPRRVYVDHKQSVGRHLQTSDWTAVTDAINSEFAGHWQELDLQPAPAADTLLVARRLSLALTGTVPSLEEIRQLEQVPPEERVLWWLRSLFADRRYSDYVGERLARAYVGTEDGPFLVFRRRRFVSWLSDCLAENRPYDQLVRALIGDEGIWTDSPGINFITVTNSTNEEGQPDPARLAARTTRAFLGVRLDCMQCHDDNMGGDWLQSDFHELAAYFAEARTSGLGIHDQPRDYKFTYLDAESSVIVEPELPFAAGVPAEGATRRMRLASWVTHPQNAAFSRATVNRVWALLFGRPLAATIDSIPLEGPFPPGLERLASDFAENGFDLQRLIVVIAHLRVFHLDSQSDASSLSPDHEMAWASFPLTRLRPEQVAGGVVQSASLSTIDSESHILQRLARSEQIGDFVKRYGDTGEDEFAARGGTIPQRLLMLNGELVKERTKDDLVSNAATRIAQQVPDDDRALEAAYLCVLTRRPDEEERAHFLPHLQQEGDRKQQLEDLFWILLNSTEFSWNH